MISLLVFTFIIVVIICISVFIIRFKKYESFSFLRNSPNELVNREKDINGCFQKIGRQQCQLIFPDTYNISKNLQKISSEIKNIKKKYQENDYFILKHIWGEQRRGLKVINYKQLKPKVLSKYDQIQKVILSDLINGFVFHVRMYLIVDCRYGNFLFDNGIVIYAKKKFNNNYNKDTIITASLKSGNQNLKVYQENKLPKDLPELFKYYESIGKSTKILQHNIKVVFKNYCRLKNFCKNKITLNYHEKLNCEQDFLESNVPKVKNKQNYYNQKQKWLFGPDLLIDKDLNCYIIEVNQFPALTLSKKEQLIWQTEIKRKLLTLYLSDLYNHHFINLGY